ncbi:unnamed protein product [Parajaminaea phylloscopi]
MEHVENHLVRDHGYLPRTECAIGVEGSWGIARAELDAFKAWARADQRAKRLDKALFMASLAHEENEAAWNAHQEWVPPKDKDIKFSAGNLGNVMAATVVGRKAMQALVRQDAQRLTERLREIDNVLTDLVSRHGGEGDEDWEVEAAE